VAGLSSCATGADAVSRKVSPKVALGDRPPCHPGNGEAPQRRTSGLL